MNPEDIQSALIGACQETATARGLIPALPGYDYDPMPKPGIAFQNVPIDRVNGTLEGGAPKLETGIFTAVIVVQSGRGTTAANGHAAAIAGLFNEGREISADSHTIKVTKTDIKSGYPTKTDWRVHVVVRYLVEI